MTSRDFLELTATFIKDADPLDYFVSLLAKLAHESVELRDRLSKLIATQTGSHQANTAQNELQASLGRVAQETRQNFETRKVWAGVEELTRRTHALRTRRFAENVSDTVLNQLHSFSEAYEQYVKGYSAHDTLVLIHAANDLHVSLESLRLVAVLAEKALGATLPEETEESLDLLMPSTPTPLQMADKLRALIDIYEKLCELLSVSPATSPLRIAKIETGTWWINLLGSARVITVMGNLLKAFARYCYQNYTITGQISELPRKAEAIEAILGLRQKLADQAINTEGMDENIQKAAIVLSQDLKALIAGEPKVVVNAVEIGITGEKTYIALQDRQANLLANSDEQTPSGGTNDESRHNIT